MFEKFANDLKESYNTIYNDLYENDYNRDDVEKGEKLKKKNPACAALCMHIRKDLLTSDREIAAFYLWAKKHNYCK